MTEETPKTPLSGPFVT